MMEEKIYDAGLKPCENLFLEKGFFHGSIQFATDHQSR
jgi:hypothetical protein